MGTDPGGHLKEHHLSHHSLSSTFFFGPFIAF